MPRIITSFSMLIEVPAWEFCNEQESTDKRKDTVCRFVNGTMGQQSCSLFQNGLYSYCEWIKKCSECLTLCSKEVSTDAK